ncbi:MAG: formate dehydrogenase [Deltaproteobacteria bacterium]|nr:formate dehydrogenase [Deltaproteobacteria bacterium]
MDGKSFLIDTLRCIGCRGCMVACKQWNMLPAEKTKNRGSYQNPPDLSAKTFTLVRFNEFEEGGKPVWTFFKEQCRHCVEPPCADAANDPEAIYVDKATGAVVYTKKTKKLNFEEIQVACPYNIPRQDPKTGQIFKCTMCIDRLKVGMLPACVKACATGALNFGDRDEILKLAKSRLEYVKKEFPKATLVDMEEVRVIYLLAYPEDKYQVGLNEKGITRKTALKKMLPALGAVVLSSIASFFEKRESA